MLASPTIPEIALALARIPSPQTFKERECSRILCLKLKPTSSSAYRLDSLSSRRAITEAFLKFSPRVQSRASSTVNFKGLSGNDAFWVFLDITSTSHLYHGEEGLMRSCMSLARDLGLSAQCAVADTPSGAQAFATSHHGTIVPSGEERDRLKDLSLPLLLQLEGLEPWERASTIENVITFFMMLGFKTAGDLSRFSLASLEERWGEIGRLLWRRIHAQDQPSIPPLLPTEPLHDDLHLAFPVSLVSLILLNVEKSVEFLFARLQGRRLFAQKLVLTLHCENSTAQHRIEIEPASPSRDRELFLNLIEQRLGDLDLINPVHNLELSVVSCLEIVHQPEFFEQRLYRQNKTRTLPNRSTYGLLKSGFFHFGPSVRPEPRVDASTEERKVPRPTRILHKPRLISLNEMENLKILSVHPIERLKSGWWSACGRVDRDYHFAVSPRGECLWIFQDLKTDEYFLHGYFD